MEKSSPAVNINMSIDAINSDKSIQTETVVIQGLYFIKAKCVVMNIISSANQMSRHPPIKSIKKIVYIASLGLTSR